MGVIGRGDGKEGMSKRGGLEQSLLREQREGYRRLSTDTRLLGCRSGVGVNALQMSKAVNFHLTKEKHINS